MTGPQDQAPVPPVTKPVTYEELTPEHKQKYDEVKAQFEADLIGSFERTHNHGIRWKGFSPEGALDNVDLSVPSEERTRALRQEMNYMVAHTLHRHSESLVNELECVESQGRGLTSVYAANIVFAHKSRFAGFADLRRPQDRR